MQKELILLYFGGYLYQKEPLGVKGNRISLIKHWMCWILNHRCTDSDLDHIVLKRTSSSRVGQSLYIYVQVPDYEQAVHFIKASGVTQSCTGS